MPTETQSFVNAVVEKLIDELSIEGYNLIVEGTLRNPMTQIHTCEKLKERGYNVSLIVIACDATVAWMNTCKRAYYESIDGVAPRFVDIKGYNETVNALLNSLEIIEKRKCFDDILIVNNKDERVFPHRFFRHPKRAIENVLGLEWWNKNVHEHAQDLEVYREGFMEEAIAHRDKIKRQDIDLERE